MTQSEYEAELHFRLCKSIFATLAAKGIIAEDDMRILLRAAGEQHCRRKELHGLSSQSGHCPRNSHRPQSGLQPMPEYPP
mgnify:CR=1 FL=1